LSQCHLQLDIMIVNFDPRWTSIQGWTELPDGPPSRGGLSSRVTKSYSETKQLPASQAQLELFEAHDKI